MRVSDGWFQWVALTNPDGKVVAGSLNRQRTAFTITEPLGYGAVYTWSGSVVGQDGRALPVGGSFTTVEPNQVVNGWFQLSDGQTVAWCTRHAAVRRADHRQGGRRACPDGDHRSADRGRVGMASRRGRRRPGALAQSGVLRAGDHRPRRRQALRVDFGDGNYGASDLTLDFGVGRRQVVKAEASSHRIQVVTDAGVIMDFPCSYGEADLPRNVTRSGIHVVTEKYADFYMSNPAAGYSNIRERWAVRISNNGEFIHANPASSGAQGNTNVTNGCINLSTADAEQYFHSAIYGDPSRSPVPRFRCPTPTATSGTGPWAGTGGRRCRPCRSPAVRPRAAGERAGDTTGAPSLSGTRRRPPRPGSAPAVESAGAGLIAGPEDDLVEVDVRGTGGDETDHLGDVLRLWQGDPGVNRVGPCRVAAEPHQ